jgi:hypothetical protein
MPRQETTLTVFVASPSDVTAEREFLQSAIEEINLTRSRELGIRLALSRWETDALPGFGKDPQQVINESTPRDYDIFIGIMWHRIGTPTLTAASGTLEEFQFAKSRFDTDPKSLRIMMYFKDAPINPSKVDALQMQAVFDFRASLGKSGGLYWTFEDTEQFERLVRIHLHKTMQDWREDGFASTSAPISDLSKEVALGDSDEPGIFDLTLDFTERFEQAGIQMVESNNVVTTATLKLGELGAKLRLHGSSKTPDDVRVLKRLFDDIAVTLTDLDKDFYQSASGVADNMEAGIDSMIKLTALQNHIKLEEEQGAIDLVQTMELAQNSIEQYRDQIEVARERLDQMPALSRSIRQAKSGLSKTFSQVIKRQERCIGLIKELKQAIFSLIRRNGQEASIV